jgi:hypothetical protein
MGSKIAQVIDWLGTPARHAVAKVRDFTIRFAADVKLDGQRDSQ